MNELPPRPRSSAPAVVVTGASTGIGLAAALALERLGWRVFAGVRREQDAERLASLALPELSPVVIDVTSMASLASAAEQVESGLAGDGLRALVNNAGVAVSGPLEHVAMDAFRRQLDVNVVGPIAAVQAFLPLLCRGPSRIVNVGSTSGRIAGPFIGPYCASKFALDALTQTLRAELRSRGIAVAIVEPGVVATPLWDKMAAAEAMLAAELAVTDPDAAAALRERQEMLRRLRRTGRSPSEVAAAIVAAVTAARPKRRYVVGLDARVKAFVASSLPEGLLERLRNVRAAIY